MVLLRSSTALALGVAVPTPTEPWSTVLPVPLGARVTFWLVPPAVRTRGPLPVMEPVLEPVPPLAMGSTPLLMPLASVVPAGPAGPVAPAGPVVPWGPAGPAGPIRLTPATGQALLALGPKRVLVVVFR